MTYNVFGGTLYPAQSNLQIECFTNPYLLCLFHQVIAIAKAFVATFLSPSTSTKMCSLRAFFLSCTSKEMSFIAIVHAPKHSVNVTGFFVCEARATMKPAVQLLQSMGLTLLAACCRPLTAVY